MIINRLSGVCLAAVMTLTAQSAFGNDIVDFFRAVNSVRHGHPAHYDHGFRPRRSFRHVGYRRGFRPYRRSVSFHIGHAPAPAPVPVVPAPVVLPHTIGQIVTCHVPLETHVRVRNAHEIAPAAQPINVAVRNPHLPAWGSHGCVESLVYVQVFAPPCPLRQMTVSPCRTVVVLDYGEWEIRIRSCNGVVEVEYDD